MIEFRGINYCINGKVILKDIQLTITDNEFVAIIGPNGAGKSTLVKILLGIIDGYTGEVFIEGTLNTLWLSQHQIGYLPQREEFDRQFPATALDLVLMGRMAQKQLFRRFTARDKRLAEQTLEEVGILNCRNQQIGNLSGGEWQRLLLARALVTGSKYLILDEPEAGVDKIGVTGFFDLLAALHKQGKTIITISHDLHTLNRYCTYLVCLNQSLHCHTQTEMVNAEHIHRTFGDTVKLIEKDY